MFVLGVFILLVVVAFGCYVNSVGVSGGCLVCGFVVLIAVTGVGLWFWCLL